ncbi:MAG TPA: radical SAM protein [Candidatus Binatia bacterium]|nr:radical SAM protein [Candidatus Binatia bacterium]
MNCAALLAARAKNVSSPRTSRSIADARDEPRREPIGSPGERLRDRLAARTARGDLAAWDGPDVLRCTACAHRCGLRDGQAGACGVRARAGRDLRVPFGYVARRHVRAIETNTVFHVRPGARALTFGMFGCDLRCPYCHNWRVSQALREGLDDERPIDATPASLVDEAVAAGAAALCAAYNEPMIAAEWNRAVFAEAKRRGLATVLVSDGNTTGEALAYMRSTADVYRVDLKGFADDQLRELGGRLRPVLDGIAEAKRLGFWVEVVTLVVPGLNDDLAGLRALAARLAEIDRDIPWHVNGFVPRHRWRDRARPDAAFLVAAAGAGYARGLRFVYAGNSLSSPVDELAHTRCPGCHAVVVRRRDFAAEMVAVREGRCPRCERPLPGLW